MKKTTLTLVTTLLALSATLVACGQQTTTNSNNSQTPTTTNAQSTPQGESDPLSQNSCHPHLNNPNGGKGDNHGTIQCRAQTSDTKQTFIT